MPYNISQPWFVAGWLTSGCSSYLSLYIPQSRSLGCHRCGTANMRCTLLPWNRGIIVHVQSKVVANLVGDSPFIFKAVRFRNERKLQINTDQECIRILGHCSFFVFFLFPIFDKSHRNYLLSKTVAMVVGLVV